MKDQSGLTVALLVDNVTLWTTNNMLENNQEQMLRCTETVEDQNETLRNQAQLAWQERDAWAALARARNG